MRSILFDLDGTLVDSSGDLTAAVNRILADDGLAPLAVDEVTAMLGDGAGVLIARAFEQRGKTVPADGLERFRKIYEENLVVETKPYPGMVELLRDLDAQSPRPAIAVVTNKPTFFAEKVLRELGLDVWLDDVVGPELVPERKPAAAHVLEALRRLDRPAANAVMIGDGSTDVLSGRRAGAQTVAVLWGYRSREQLVACEPHDVVADVDELRAVLGVQPSTLC